MSKYIFWRLVWAIPSVLGIVTVAFLLTRVLPGDPTQAIIGEFPAPPGYVELIRQSFGLNQPLYVQYWFFLVNLVQGNLGFSFAQSAPVLPLLLQRAWFTLLLMIPALMLASFFGVILGLISAPRVGSRTDYAVTVISILGSSLPTFWVGMLAMLFFGVTLRVLPANGMTTVGGPTDGIGFILDVARHWILPGTILVLAYLTVVARVSRSTMIESLSQDYVLTAQAKGASRRQVLLRHVLPNSLAPIITVIGFNFGLCLTGAVLTETVFGWPGLGSLFVYSINNRDYPVIQGVFLLSSTAVVLVNLVVDVLYAVIDPRLRSSDAVR